MSRTVAAWQPLFLNILAAAETMSSSVAIRPSSPVQPAQDLRFPGGPPSALMQAQRVAEKEGSPAGRLLFLDNLRLTIIILVIGMHADDTHSPLRLAGPGVRRPQCRGSSPRVSERSGATGR